MLNKFEEIRQSTSIFKLKDPDKLKEEIESLGEGRSTWNQMGVTIKTEC
jgi:hypothetical protein